MPIATNTIARVTERIESKKEAEVKKTDWDKTAVLDIVERLPEPTTHAPTLIGKKVLSPEFHRYPEQAPPMSEYADGKHKYEVTRLTRPLLEAKAKDHPEVKSFL